MILPDLERNDLLTDINPEELDGLVTSAQEQGQDDPIEQNAKAAASEIHLYVDPLLVPDVCAQILTKAYKVLTIASLYNRVSTIPEKRVEEQKWARKLLQELRDRKFTALAVDPVTPPVAPSAFGSAKKISGFNPAYRS